MNNSSDNQRKKRIVSGAGSVQRRNEKPVQTNGPVGRKDAYEGRRTQFQSAKPTANFNQQQQSNQQGGSQQSFEPTQSTGSRSGGFKIGRVLFIVGIVILAIVVIRFTACRGGCAMTDLISGENPISDVSDIQTGADYTDSQSENSASDLWQSIFNTGSESFNTFDSADNNAAAALTASTSSESADLTVSNKARSRYTSIKGGGKDEVTVMVYLCGSDLESEHGMATADLNEMLHADLNDDQINIIVETGGAKKWNNSVVSAKTNQRYRVTSRGLEILDRDVGKRSMVDPSTLVDFIKFCAKNYPANRYMLIFWDHGGGSISGYGYDQNNKGTMTLDKINSALKNGGVQFDFVGFDACLMGTLETAVVTEPYADYLIASEEAEPGCGWYYTNWLTKLSKNPSIGTVELSKTLIDDFNNVCKKNYPGCNTTLSIVDLAEFAGTVPTVFNAFSGELSDKLDASEYKQIADARSDVREFGVSAKVNHIDIIDFCNKIGTKKANALSKVLSGCIKYNKTSASMANSYGLSIFFPYSSFKNMNSAVALYDSIGMDENYTSCLKSFASLAAGGQIATGGTTSSPLGSLLGSYSGGSSYSSGDMLSTLLGGYLGGGNSSGSGDLLSSLFGSSAPSTSATDFLGGILGGDSSSWFDSSRVLRASDYYDDNMLTVADMALSEKGDGWVLSLDQKKWDLVENVQINLFIKDGDGYIDLGMDDMHSFDDDGDLEISFDNTWLSLDGQVVAYYFMGHVEDGDNWATVGRVPALVNGERFDLIIVFDNETEENEYGYFAGAQRIYNDDETDTVAKGLVLLQKGDKIDFLCDYYGTDGSYQDSYYLGKRMTYDGSFTVGYIDLGDAECDVTYCLTDIYNNEFWTETLTFE